MNIMNTRIKTRSNVCIFFSLINVIWTLYIHIYFQYFLFTNRKLHNFIYPSIILRIRGFNFICISNLIPHCSQEFTSCNAFTPEYFLYHIAEALLTKLNPLMTDPQLRVRYINDFDSKDNNTTSYKTCNVNIIFPTSNLLLSKMHLSAVLMRTFYQSPEMYSCYTYTLTNNYLKINKENDIDGWINLIKVLNLRLYR